MSRSSPDLATGDLAFHKEVKRRTGAGVDVALDCVGAPTLNSSLRSLRAMGRVVVIGNVTMERAEINAGMMILNELSAAGPSGCSRDDLPRVRRGHADLGRLGVFWHTQGSGKSYSMAFFAEKVRRVVPGNFTFVVMTDREDLDDQIWRTFIGCGVADAKTPRAGSGRELKETLRENHRFVFTLIHKFNQPVAEPYSERDDIIVISDEAHRTQAGKFARNMRLALPNAAFIGFTGTPLFKHDHLTKRIFGGYVSRYDWRSGRPVQSAGLREPGRSSHRAAGPERPHRGSHRECRPRSRSAGVAGELLGKDCEVITADDRLDKWRTILSTLHDPLGERQVVTGLHRQGHLCLFPA